MSDVPESTVEAGHRGPFDLTFDFDRRQVAVVRPSELTSPPFLAPRASRENSFSAMKRAHIGLLGLLAVGIVIGALAPSCRRKQAPVPLDTLSSADASIAEPGVSEGDGLGFEIVAVYTGQAPTKAPPFHADGGSYTYFDARMKGGARFTFGFAEPKPAGGGMPMSFGDVLLYVSSPSEGQKLVTEVARTFHGKEPPAHPAATLPAPVPIRAVFLAMGVERKEAGFGGSGGGYYATKLFLQRRGLEAEVFFNFSLVAKRGQFAEKDADYADDMVAFLAGALRDGPPAPRDPKTEPRVSAVGPTVTWQRELLGEAYGFDPDGAHYWVTRKTPEGSTKLVSIALEKAGDEQEVLSVAHTLGDVQCVADTCVATDQRPKQKGVFSGDDPRSVLLVDRAKKTQRELTGPWGEKAALPTENALSSDGRTLAVGAWLPTGKGQGQYRTLYLVDREGSVRGPVDVGKESWDIESFSPTRLTLVVGNAWDKAVKPKLVDVDPKTLAVSEPRPRPEAQMGLSPDKKRRVSCDEDGSRITVTDLATKESRTFAVFEEDQRGLKDACVEWAGSRFLVYEPGFLDTGTMKVSLTGFEDERHQRLEYDRSFRHVVSRRPKVWLGKVTVP